MLASKFHFMKFKVNLVLARPFENTVSLQRYEEAISYFDKALEINQFETTILCNNSIAKLTVGDKEAL